MSDSETPIASVILTVFSDLLATREPYFTEIGITLPIPIFSVNELLDVTALACRHFASQPSLLTLQSPLYVIGDIHGNVTDLIRVLVTGGLPPASRYLFLGDYVDRGDYSSTVLALLYALVCRYPSHMFLLRGNHEVEKVNGSYGFRDELDRSYGHDAGRIFAALNESFDHMPIAALIDEGIFCVHGGISPGLASLAQIAALERPIRRIDGRWLTDLLWSDPSDQVQRFGPNPRGQGVLFGEAAVADFVAAMKITRIVRAHQCVESGVTTFAAGALTTVFSSSNYEAELHNSCGMLYIGLAGEIRTRSLPPVPRVEFYSALLDVRGGNVSTVKNSNSLGRLKCMSVKGCTSHPPTLAQLTRNVSTILTPKLPVRELI
jgi:protein phosphatase